MKRTIIATFLLLVLFSCNPVDDPMPTTSEPSYFPGLSFRAANTGQFPVMLSNLVSAEPENLTIEVWYYNVDDNTDDALADVMGSPNMSADDEISVVAKGVDYSNYNQKKQVRAYFDEAATVVLRVKSGKRTLYCTFRTTSRNQVVSFMNAGGGRLAASINGKITFEYMNNENEIFRPSSWTVRLWASDAVAEPSRASVDSYGSYDHPKYTVVKSGNKRAYTRKTVKADWYIAEFDGSGHFQKLQVSTGGDGLLVYNEQNLTGSFSGYFPAHGKIKVGWAKAPGQDANTVLKVFKSGSAYSSFWLYAEDGTTSAKAQFWFMPTGSYNLNYNLRRDDRYPTRDTTVSISPGTAYPYVKMRL